MLASGKLGSYQDTHQNLGLANLHTESQGAVDKDTRKHLSVELESERKRLWDSLNTQISLKLSLNTQTVNVVLLLVDLNEVIGVCFGFGEKYPLNVFSPLFSDSLNCYRNSWCLSLWRFVELAQITKDWQLKRIFVLLKTIIRLFLLSLLTVSSFGPFVIQPEVNVRAVRL